MKKFFTLLIGILFVLTSKAITHNITTNWQSFDPTPLNINIGDTVHFILGVNHNAVEVSQSTYNQFGNTPLNGGFSFGFEADTIFIPTATGNYYYVCTPHAANGMVGMFTVNNPGCTDLLACNYDPSATIDDGSCAYPTSNSTALTECDSYTWPVNGITYISGGIYTDVSTNAAGCLHTDTLNLTINNSTSNITTLTECDSYTWPVNGITYISGGIYTDVSTNAAGCLHTDTLNLTINNSTSNITTLTECDSYTWPVNGITYISGGIYTDVSTNISGCQHTDTLNLTINISPILSVDSSNYNGFGVLCNGDNDGYINLSVTGAVPSYSYLWSNGSTTQNISNLSAGTYSVTVTDLNQCTTSETHIITEPILLTSSVDTSNFNGFGVHCNGDNDGYINLSVNDGVPTYSYLWSNGATTQNISNLSAGTYSVTVTDLNLCTTVETVVITEPNSFVDIGGGATTSSYAGGFNISCNGYNTGTITVQAGGGVAPYTYSEGGSPNSPSTTSGFFDNLYEGTYNLSVEDANQCEINWNNILLTEPTELTSGISNSSNFNGFGVLCNGYNDGYIDLSVNGAVPTYSFLWSNGATTQNISNLSAGTYSVTVTDLNQCTTSETHIITEPILLTSSVDTSNFNGFGVHCNGDNDGYINLSVNDGVPTYSYLWSNGATTQNISNLSAGTYSVTVTDLNLCTTVETVVITEPDLFVGGQLNTSQTICYNTIPNSINTIVSPTGGSPGYTYNWLLDTGSGPAPFSNGNSDSFSPSNLTVTTDYIIEYSDFYQCNTFTESVTITVLPQINPGTIISNQILCYDSLASDLFVDVSASGGNGSFNYQWYSDETGSWDIILGANSTTYSPGYMNTSTSYTLEVVSDHDVNCISRNTDTINIYVYDSLNPGSISSDQIICYNTIPNPISFNSLPQGAEGTYSYQWFQSTDNNTFIIMNGEDNDILQPTNLIETTYYRLNVTSDFGCGTKLTNTITITVYDEFLIGDISDNDTICYLEDPNQINLDPITTGADGNYIYQWYSDETGSWDIILGANSDSYQPTGLSDSTYYQLVVSNLFCNQDLNTNIVNIVVNPLPDIFPIIGDMIVCSNQNDANYTLSTTPQNYRYEWSTNDGTIVGTNQSVNCLINWPSNPASTANLEVDVWIVETGCQITTFGTVDLTSNESPETADVIQKPNSDILICNDSTIGIHYVWGYTNIISGIDTYMNNDTLRYAQYDSNINTNVNYYWVETYFNYPNVSCYTRSYLNPPPPPLGVDEINATNFNVYPNPTTDKLYYNISGDLDINVMDLLGKNISCEINYLNKSIDVSSLKTGVYIIVVKTNKTEFIKKFIIK